LPEEVQGDISLWDEEVPAVGGEIRVSPTQHGDEVIFEGLNSPFTRVGSMIVWWYELVFKFCNIFNVCLEKS
jgi:hypothetical protein